MSWPVGTIIVCINDRTNPDAVAIAKPSALVVQGCYYTVRGWAFSPLDHFFILYLTEIHAAINPQSGIEFGWDPRSFRKAGSDHSEAGTVHQSEPVSA